MAAQYGLKIVLLLVFGNVCSAVESNTSGVLSTSELSDGSSRILSRRKRYLVFPDGSSFQLVFCTENQGYLQVGDVVWFGNTAALAWELPTDPKIFYHLKEHEKVFEQAQNRDGASKHIYYLDEDGKVLSKVPYKKKFIINPAFAKRSVDEEKVTKENQKQTPDIKKMHMKQMKTKLLKYLDKDSIEFHRINRVSLLPKLEVLLEGLGWRGKQCVLRMLCESAKKKTKQGTFLEEIVMATFMLPPGKGFADQVRDEYDRAHKSSNNCVQLYPQCINFDTFPMTQ